MYDPLLDTFLCVADSGSFTKAAEKLYISSTAVMKQINQLEKQLNMRLLERTHHGVHLTRAGESVYHDARFMIQYAHKAIVNAHSLAFNDEHDEGYFTFCVGTSLLRPCNELVELWNRIRDQFPQYRLHLNPFEDSAIAEVLAELGTHYDFLISPYMDASWATVCGFAPLGECGGGYAVPLGHRLAKRRVISADDLHGETVMMARRGMSSIEDQTRDMLEQEHPQVRIEDITDAYTIDIFNRCERNGYILSTLDRWRDVHPGLATIPADWRPRQPYGILYPLNAPGDTLEVLQALLKAAAQIRVA